ncbi:MAG: hypothetical protein IPJ06_13570 [Saprospiraceae bacterium]|nr:hypothetical protein [Saprospiraceae bacterium]
MEFTNLAFTIQQHLIRRGRAVLPALGVLQLVYKPARLVRQEGVMYPPAETVSFESTAGGDEDIHPELVDDYRQASGIQQEDLARKGLKEQILLVIDALEEGQPVHLPQVGTWMKNKAGIIEFTPDDFNYYLEVYGLGAVQARPVLRRTPEEAARAAQESRSKIVVTPPGPAVRRWKDRLFLPGLAALLILSLAGCLWLIFTPDSPDAASGSSLLSPEMESDTEADLFTAEAGDVTEDILGDPEADTTEVVPEVEKASILPQQPDPHEEPSRSRIRIAVGHFSQSANAALLADRLSKAGFLATSESVRDGLTRVVVEVDPSRRDPREVLRILQGEYEPTAWIISQ